MLGRFGVGGVWFSRHLLRCCVGTKVAEVSVIGSGTLFLCRGLGQGSQEGQHGTAQRKRNGDKEVVIVNRNMQIKNLCTELDLVAEKKDPFHNSS